VEESQSREAFVNQRDAQPRQIRYAVVGLGHLAQAAILPAFANTTNSKLAALVSGDAGKSAGLADKYGVRGRYTYDQYEQCLADGVDAVYIVLPNHLHKEYSVRAAKAGVHVLCEKPLAVTQAECEEMIRTAEENDVKLMVAYRLHLEESTLQAMRAVREGSLGELRIFSSDFSQQVAENNVRLIYPVAEGGGPLYDMGVYCINAARNFFRSEPIAVSAVSANHEGPRFAKTEEMVSAVMHFPGERLATFTCSFGAAYMDHYTLIGAGAVLTASPGYSYSSVHKHLLTANGTSDVRHFAKTDEFATQLDYFSDCILHGKQPGPSGAEGLADVRVIEAMYESIRTGKVVHLSALRRLQNQVRSVED
jgi:glucose-fructose oxidoreductase